ncbi:NAD(P)/FAD-dependent oxidoreductase [Chelativorans intermedius]|uniref:NAD(P)/FAD-dependent oxidoreductase n=1 Tax=Chelativorans intermedius TaxID=515947 RepID=A0ABV6D9U5_9HYPH|nr:FAD-binding oxidoreductase [Chelativorans intermedius]MCT8997841.1 FAD-binding oxidoreductase [Chelativorans intermedius]
MGGKTARDAQIIVIGGGIVGIAVAAYLAEAGRDVLVLDRSGICEETSSGNAGALAFPDILPLVHKDMLSQVPRWLADPLGPLSIPPAYMPRLLPWLWRFLRAGRSSNFAAAMAAQASMMRLAEREWSGLMIRSGTADMLREDGALELYESEEEFRAAEEGWAARRRLHIPFRHLEREEIAAYQPGLSECFVRATFMPGWKTVADPQRLGQAVWAYAERNGARFMPATVAAARAEGEGVAVQLSGGRRLLCDRLVVAAGAWSRPFAAAFGDRVPLETERGYNTTLPPDAFEVKRQLIFARHGFVVTPLEGGLRIGGAVEFGGLKRPPNYARSRAMLEKAARFLPGLRTQGGRQWMGYRPSLPDSLPVIDRAWRAPRVLYAFGHGHLGLTQAAATGRLIRDLVLEQSPPIDLRPFRARRFRSHGL